MVFGDKLNVLINLLTDMSAKLTTKTAMYAQFLDRSFYQRELQGARQEAVLVH